MNFLRLTDTFYININKVRSITMTSHAIIFIFGDGTYLRASYLEELKTDIKITKNRFDSIKNYLRRHEVDILN